MVSDVLRRIKRAYLFIATFLLFARASVHRTVATNDYNGNNDGYQSCPSPISSCSSSVVQVYDISWVCNSRYTYRWGNGAHVNSILCANQDYATFSVSFYVVDTITEVSDIYVSMAIQDYKTRNIIQSRAPCYLCNMVGTSCTGKGDYTFSMDFRIVNNGDSSSSDDFCPVLIMAFSTEEDSGYNLGAVNMECEEWDNALATWTETHTVTPRDWLRNYGMILATGICLIIFSGFVWQQARRAATFRSCVDPCIMELDDYYSYRYPPQRAPSAPTTISTQERVSSNGLPLHQPAPGSQVLQKYSAPVRPA